MIVKGMRGGSPSYSLYHVYMALKLIAEGPRGRPSLVRDLGLGEASARTLLKRLKSADLLVQGQKGSILSSEGRRLLELLSRIVRVSRVQDPVWGGGYVVYTDAVNPPVDMVSIYRIRDYLVMHGCREAVIGGLIGGSPRFPGLPDGLADMIAGILPSLGDGLVLLVPEDCFPHVFDAVVDLVIDHCKPGG